MIVNSKAPINGRRPRDGNSKGKDDGDGGGDDDDDRILGYPICTESTDQTSWLRDLPSGTLR